MFTTMLTIAGGIIIAAFALLIIFGIIDVTLERQRRKNAILARNKQRRDQ